MLDAYRPLKGSLNPTMTIHCQRERETTKEINKHRKKRKTDREGETARDREVRVLAS